MHILFTPFHFEQKVDGTVWLLKLNSVAVKALVFASQISGSNQVHCEAECFEIEDGQPPKSKEDTLGIF